jgi:hypothetical protein
MVYGILGCWENTTVVQRPIIPPTLMGYYYSITLSLFKKSRKETASLAENGQK